VNGVCNNSLLTPFTQREKTYVRVIVNVIVRMGLLSCYFTIGGERHARLALEGSLEGG